MSKPSSSAFQWKVGRFGIETLSAVGSTRPVKRTLSMAVAKSGARGPEGHTCTENLPVAIRQHANMTHLPSKAGGRYRIGFSSIRCAALDLASSACLGHMHGLRSFPGGLDCRATMMN